jgi:glucose-6-phosphate-specific signal transduction histidine kinase
VHTALLIEQILNGLQLGVTLFLMVAGLTSTIGIFVIPMLYVVFQRLREKKWRRKKAQVEAVEHGHGSP